MYLENCSNRLDSSLVESLQRHVAQSFVSNSDTENVSVANYITARFGAKPSPNTVEEVVRASE